jgi:hypothetical protein
LHGLCKLRVALVHEYNLSGVFIFLAVDLLVSDCDAIQILHVLLTSDVTACDSVFFEVNCNAAARNKVVSFDLVLRVIWAAEEFTSFFIEELLVHC